MAALPEAPNEYCQLSLARECPHCLVTFILSPHGWLHIAACTLHRIHPQVHPEASWPACWWQTLQRGSHPLFHHACLTPALLWDDGLRRRPPRCQGQQPQGQDKSVCNQVFINRLMCGGRMHAVCVLWESSHQLSHLEGGGGWEF